MITLMKQQIKLANLFVRIAVVLVLLIIAYQMSNISTYLSRIEAIVSSKDFSDVNHINITQPAHAPIPASQALAPKQHNSASVVKAPQLETMAKENDVQSIKEVMQKTPVAKSYPNAKELEVQMLNYGDSGAMVYQPAVIKIKEGDSIRFKPTSYGHNSQSIEELIGTDEGMPKGASPWKGDMNEELVVQFTVPGVYLYACSYHYIVGHVGVIQVGDDKHNMEAINRAANLLKGKMLSNADRVDTYLSQL